MDEPYFVSSELGLEIPKSVFLDMTKFHEMLMTLIRLDASREVLLQMFHEWSYYSGERNGGFNSESGTEQRGISSD